MITRYLKHMCITHYYLLLCVLFCIYCYLCEAPANRTECWHIPTNCNFEDVWALSVCPPSVKDQSEPSSGSCRESIYGQSPSRKPTLQDPLFTYSRKATVEHKSDHAGTHPFTTGTATRQIGDNTDAFEEHRHWPKVSMESKAETDSADGAVAYESIADAARTRHMWQQMATQRQNGDQRNYDHNGTPVSMNLVNGELHQKLTNGSHRNGYANDRNQNGDQPNAHKKYGTMPKLTRWQHQESHQQSATSPVAVSGRVTPDSTLENEKRIFMAYVLSHQDLVTSLGISIPWQARQRYQQYVPSGNVRVELAVVGGGLDDLLFTNKQHATGRTVSVSATGLSASEKENGHRFGGQMNGAGRLTQPQPQQPAQHNMTGRYIKNSQVVPTNGNLAGNGWKNRIVRRQGPTICDDYNIKAPPPSQNTPETCTMPRQWKVAHWNDTQPSTNKITSPRGDGEPFVDEDGNVFKSLGESIIAKEIREYREREEELRRSRSELGLPCLEDMLDTWKENRSGRAQSVDHLQAALDAESPMSPVNRKRSGSIDRFNRVAQNGANNRSTSVGPTLHENRFAPIDNGRYQKSIHGPKNSYEKFLQSHNGNENKTAPKLATYSSISQQSSHFVDTQSVFTPIKRVQGSDSLPIEARIGQEMEELRRREEELRAQREAAGMRYTPNGIQASPVTAASPSNSSSSNLSITQNKGSNGSSREYVAHQRESNVNNCTLVSKKSANACINANRGALHADCDRGDHKEQQRQCPSGNIDLHQHDASNEAVVSDASQTNQPKLFSPVELKRKADVEDNHHSAKQESTAHSPVNGHEIPGASVSSPSSECEHPEPNLEEEFKKNYFSSEEEEHQENVDRWIEVGKATNTEKKQKWDVEDIIVSI